MPDQFFINNELSSDPVEIADSFNNYFSTIGDNLVSDFIPTKDFLNYMPANVTSVFSFHDACVEEIKEIVRWLRDSCQGVDGLPAKIFKINIDNIAEIITFICNKSMSSGIFPERLAVAIVACVYKAGEHQQFTNYRALSILNVFSKILEILVEIRLMNYFVDNNFLSSSQFGFKRGLSTADALRKFVDSVYDVFDAGKIAVGVF